jgi:hypothetical protein
MEVVNMEIQTPLSPESLTAVEILESINAAHQNQAVEMLRNYAHELGSEQKWEELHTKHPGSMIKIAKQTLEEHAEGKSQKL